eukprot:7391129-Prymnesium_polylepis.1
MMRAPPGGAGDGRGREHAAFVLLHACVGLSVTPRRLTDPDTTRDVMAKICGQLGCILLVRARSARTQRVATHSSDARRVARSGQARGSLPVRGVARWQALQDRQHSN